MIRIIQADPGDLQAILSLQYAAYQSEAKLHNNPDIPPLKQTLDEVIREYQLGIFLKAIDADDLIIGSVRAHAENGTLYIGKLIVHPTFQGQGIGTKLLAEIEKAIPLERYELFTSTKSTRNISLYQRLGYKPYKTVQVHADLAFVYMEKLKMRIQ